jgi:DNA-binding response OmpR family regulator
MKVLAVDDDQTILDLVTTILSHSAHHEVTTAPSVMEALEEIEEADAEFDCFLVDYEMPEVDGTVLVKLIRETPGYENTPVLMLTAMHEKRYLDSAFSAGATDYITKPVDYTNLTTRIQSAQKLSIEKTRLQNQPLMAGEMKGMSGEPKNFRLRDPITLAGINGAIDFCEFENYVQQLTRRRIFGATAFAVKIGSVEQVYKEASSEDFETLLRRVAAFVQRELMSGNGVLSYRGGGVFLCVPEKRLRGRWNTRKSFIRKRYELARDDTGDDPLQLLVGDEVRLSTAPFVRSLESLSSAIDSAETRASQLWNPLEAPKRFLANQWSTEPERQLERRAYDALLQSAFSETRNKAWHRKLEQRRQLQSKT